ncbi:MAG: T9SS type A sorting domain-containing protein [Flavobacterium sp.]
MKKITLGLFLLCASIAVQAQDFSQTTSQEVVEASSVACGDPNGTSASNYYRAYNLPTLGVTSDYGVSSVTFGIENNTAEVELTINLYATTANFPTGFTLVPGPNYNLVGTTTVTVDDTDILSLVTVPFTNAVVPVGSKLVIEISHDDTAAKIYMGANGLGQTATGYLSSEACGITAPTPFAGVGFPNAHLIINVSGTALSVKNNTLDQVSVYPNPTSGMVQVTLPSSVEILSVSVSDLSGKRMNANVSGTTVDMSNFASGVYMINVNTTEGNLVRKVMKN